MSIPTTKWGFLIPDYDDGPDGADVPHWLDALADRLEEVMVGYDMGTYAGMPDAGKAGRQYWATDFKTLFWDTGAEWIVCGYQPGDYRFTARAPLEPGFLACDGSTFSPTVYPVLYDILGTATLPDFRERFPMGASAAAVRGSTGGSDTHTHTTADHVHTTPSHTHTVPGHVHLASGLIVPSHTLPISLPVNIGAPANRGTGSSPTSGAGESTAYTNHVHPNSSVSGNTGASGDLGVTGQTASGGAGSTGSGGAGSTGPGGAGSTGSASSRPRYVACNVWIKT